ncbi:hypothetical protein COO60DRAFT_995842 [Scenedesmus sp. NREL 46B-D3]|nr:hypothetical protein COO60DRAFT_995842 [Scenedesmus sp. NREL 46B-D3]
MQMLPPQQLPSQHLDYCHAAHGMRALQQQHQQCAEVLEQQLAAGLESLPHQQIQIDRSNKVNTTAQNSHVDAAAAVRKGRMQGAPPAGAGHAAGGSVGQPSSATSSETRAAADWSPEHAGQKNERNSEEPAQQACAAAMLQPGSVHGLYQPSEQCQPPQQRHLATYVHQHQYQPDQHYKWQHRARQLQHMQQQLRHQWAEDKMQSQQQQYQHQQQQFSTGDQGSRPLGHWRSSAAPNMWQALDPLRQPLLQAHSLLGCSATSPQLLGLLSTQAETAAGGNSSSGMLLSECWRLLRVHAQLAQQAKQQQQQRALLLLQQAPAAAGRAPFRDVLQAQQLRQQAQQRPQPPQQQQHRPEQQPELECAQPQRRMPAAAAAAAAVTAAATVSSKQGSWDSSAVPPAVQQRRGPKKPAAARPPMPKPPTKPWQPKMAPDDRNWSKLKFNSVSAHADEVLKRCRQLQQLRPLPDQETARFAMLMMLHGAGWPNHELWEQWQQQHEPGEVTMMVHLKAGVDAASVKTGGESIAARKLATSVEASWGDISLVEAQLDSMAELLRRCPNVTHIGLASGHDIPVQVLRPGLLMPGVSMFGAYQFPDVETRTLKVAALDLLVDDLEMDMAEAQRWAQALNFHHQWMVLAREHAAALVLLTKEIGVVGRAMHKACNSVKAGMAPDEFILLTALRAHGYARSVQRVELKPGMRYPPGTLLNSYPTLVLFPAESSPHPVLWTDLHTKTECQVERHTGQQYFKRMSLRECLKVSVDRCAIFFRKVEMQRQHGDEALRLLEALQPLWHGRSSTARKRGKRKRGTSQLRSSKGCWVKCDGAAGATDSAASSAADSGAAAGSVDGDDDDEAETPPRPVRKRAAASS